MAAARLTSLYPSLFRTTQLVARRTSVRQRPRTSASTTGFHSSEIRPDRSRPERYGTAKEPPPHLKSEEEAGENEKAKKEEAQAPNLAESILLSQDNNYTALPAPKSTTAEQPSSPPPSNPQDVPDKEPGDGKTVDTVLEMPSLSEEEDKTPPHLQAPRYVHHFDTWSLVRDLDNGGFGTDQSVTLMKAVRQILADNMELARRALVSKSNVENETYLFRAACAELKTEIQNNRKAEGDKWRSQRAQLQHDVDILSQKMTQDGAGLKDELKGMFDDRKMMVRMEQKEMERKIQELNYKITVAMNSDTRGDIEGVRWLLTRRAALAIAIAVSMVLGTLNYSRFMHSAQEGAQKSHAKDMQDDVPPPSDHLQKNTKKVDSHGLGDELLSAPEALNNG